MHDALGNPSKKLLREMMNTQSNFGIHSKGSRTSRMKFGGSALRDTSESFYDNYNDGIDFKVVRGLRKDISGP